MELDFHGAAAMPQQLFDWQPDAERLERETRTAELRGQRDDLTLAEIECSIDLIDAEMATLRGRRGNMGDSSDAIDALHRIKGTLLGLANRLQRLPA